MLMKGSNRLALYLVTNVCFVMIAAVAATLHSGDGHVLYLSSLFALCSAPVLCLDRLNGRYVLLAVFMPFYFLFFGMLDLLGLLFGSGAANNADGMSAAEWGILSGLVCLLAGYLVGARQPLQTSSQSGLEVDWPKQSILVVGLALWLIGGASIIYFQVYVVPEKTNQALGRGLLSLGPVLTFLVMLGHLVAPLGLLIIAYGYARSRTTFWLALILLLVLSQVAIAFVTDIRGQALTPVAVVIVALTLTDNKVPKVWLLGSIVAIAVILPVLTAYRGAITGERGLSREEAVQNLGKVIDVVLAYRDKVASRPGDGQTLFERASLKDNVERIFAHTGVDVPFQEGATLVAIPLAFVPRLILPDKRDVPTGQLFNHEFYRSEFTDTYISPSHLGELYWNFGWPGLLGGMLAIGFLLGFVGRKCDLSQQISVTRILVLLATVQYLCQGFEGATSVSYISWFRSLAVMGILHVLLARRAAAQQVSEPALAKDMAVRQAARFPNTMQ
jgi:hypothetical protein